MTASCCCRHRARQWSGVQRAGRRVARSAESCRWWPGWLLRNCDGVNLLAAWGLFSGCFAVTSRRQERSGKGDDGGYRTRFATMTREKREVLTSKHKECWPPTFDLDSPSWGECWWDGRHSWYKSLPAISSGRLFGWESKRKPTLNREWRWTPHQPSASSASANGRSLG